MRWTDQTKLLVNIIINLQPRTFLLLIASQQIEMWQPRLALASPCFEHNREIFRYFTEIYCKISYIEILRYLIERYWDIKISYREVLRYLASWLWGGLWVWRTNYNLAAIAIKIQLKYSRNSDLMNWTGPAVKSYENSEWQFIMTVW